MLDGSILGLSVPPQTWAYGGFLLAMVLMLALDLGLLNRKAHVIGVRESLAWSALWVSLAFAFTIFVYFAYQRHWLDLGLDPPRTVSGAPGVPLTAGDAAMNYIGAYLTEYALSMDNIFVIATIFKYFRTPPEHQHRVLFWGIVGVVVLRGAMIAGGAWALDQFPGWMFYIFGGILLLTAIKMLTLKEEDVNLDHNFMVRAARRILPFSKDYHGHRFFARVDGRRLATPLLLTLITVELADAVFAVDSIPAAFAVTTEPFLVFTSNMFAILGLRSLFFAMSAFIEKFRYLKVSLAFILVYLGIKMIMHGRWHIGPEQNLAVLVGMLAVGVAASLIDDRGRELKRQAFLGPDVERYAKPAFRQARRLVIFVIGGTIFLIGLVMLIPAFPGPGFIVVPIGLAVLATEFWWARRLLRHFKQQGRNVTKRARGWWKRGGAAGPKAPAGSDQPPGA